MSIRRIKLSELMRERKNIYDIDDEWHRQYVKNFHNTVENAKKESNYILKSLEFDWTKVKRIKYTSGWEGESKIREVTGIRAEKCDDEYNRKKIIFDTDISGVQVYLWTDANNLRKLLVGDMIDPCTTGIENDCGKDRDDGKHLYALTTKSEAIKVSVVM